MVPISILLMTFVCLGLFARTYDTRIRLLVFCVAIGTVLYFTLG